MSIIVISSAPVARFRGDFPAASLKLSDAAQRVEQASPDSAGTSPRPPLKHAQGECVYLPEGGIPRGLPRGLIEATAPAHGGG